MRNEVTADKQKQKRTKKVPKVKQEPTRRSSRSSKPRRILNVEAWGDHDEYDPLESDYSGSDDSAESDEGTDKKKRRNKKMKRRRISLSPSTTPKIPKPSDLERERYAHDGWMLLCACVLMTRCSSAATKEKCIGGFFDMCPKPSDFGTLDPEELRKMVHSLGFQVDRVRSLSAVTTAWLTRGEFGLDLIPVEKGGQKIWGAGAFTVDSYYLFAKGDKEWDLLCDIDDVKWFRGWLRGRD
ncbi:hypothetical protein TrRE_jg12233 [Triparma retinervis]|uniref:Uncharacterized protein n=1 Tax=Triparma retinervis TaxID=2557542 RepID=A0A9W7DSB8_9STRA|nr:hypothetical protein TrRE_jg12233 [Triparma retinervis]